ncbi:MAG: hypothetical protein K5633_05870 [Paludibacteraceae bacterium]|nr:hypothetical protein [Paludibacteraceae bacterium]
MRTILTFLFLSLSIATFAQDLIVTRDNKLIEANITEVANDAIRYKKANAIDGPVFVIPVSDITSVVYRDGEVQSFGMEANKTPSQTPSAQATPSSLAAESANEKIIYTAAEFSGDTLPHFEYKKVFIPEKGKMKKRYVGGNMILKTSEFEKFLDAYCNEVYKRAVKSVIFASIGDIILIAGLSISPILMIEEPLVAPAVLGISSMLSLPFLITSLYYSSNLLEHYNASCAGTPVRKR